MQFCFMHLGPRKLLYLTFLHPCTTILFTIAQLLRHEEVCNPHVDTWQPRTPHACVLQAVLFVYIVCLPQVCDQEVLCGHLKSLAAEAAERQALLQARLDRYGPRIVCMCDSLGAHTCKLR